VVVAVGWPPLYFEDQGGIVHCANPFTMTASQWLGNLTLTEVWRHHLFGEPIRYILGQSWSLCYEEQFYALCGLLLFLGARRFFVGTVVLTVGVLAVAPLSFVWPGSTKGFFFDGFWLLFALGVLIYYRLNYPPKRLDGLCWLLFGIGPATFMAFCAGVLPENPTLITISYELTIGSVFSLVLLFLHGRDAALMQSQLMRPFAFCGTMCYSLYLIHWPLAEIVGLACYHLGVRHMWDTLLITVPLVMVLSIGAAWVFYQLVERHFLNATAR
jgi:peptidoglycan/LPS O-acetylase OafA/YrhL